MKQLKVKDGWHWLKIKREYRCVVIEKFTEMPEIQQVTQTMKLFYLVILEDYVQV
jgi:hypothetical protein